MPAGTPFWSVVVPAERTNLVSNPSFERGTAGWGVLTGGALGTTAAVQQFGAWSGSIAPSSNSTAGALGPVFTAALGSAYNVSAYVRGATGIPYMLAVGDSNGANLQGSILFTGGGTWERYRVAYTEAAGATRRIVIRKNANASTGAVFVDGAQVEVGSVTTYLDGDQDGGVWLGVPHASPSYRSGQSRQGGSVVALADLGFTVNESPGIGMPPLQTTSQNYALIDGASYQRTRAAARSFSLTSDMTGTSWADLHIIRQRVIDALKIDAVVPQQPTRFYYTGGVGTMQIDAVYDAGLEFHANGMSFNEQVAVRFLAFDPFWKSPTQQGTALAAQTNLGSANYMAWRDPQGRWGTMGANGTTLQTVPTAITPIQQFGFQPSGTLIFVGSFGTYGGTAQPNIGFWTPGNNRFGTYANLTGFTSLFWSVAVLPDESFYVSSNNAFGTNFSMWRNTAAGFSTVTNTQFNAPNNNVRTLLYAPTGTLYMGGDFTSPGNYVAAWDGAAFTFLAGVEPNNSVFALAYNLAGTLYMGGAFGSIGGTAAGRIGFWKGGTFGTVPGIRGGANGTNVYALTVAPDQRLYLGGEFSSAGNVTANNIAVFNGVQMASLGSGFPVAGTASIRTVRALADGRILVGGTYAGTAGNTPTPDNFAIWNGYAFFPLDINLPGTAIVNDYLQASNGTAYISFRTAGTATAAAVTTIINSGRAIGYPTVTMRNTGATNARVFQLLNTTTGDNLYFNLSVLPGETITVALTPGNRTLSSDFRGNVLSSLLPGSNLASWRLLPGVNVISFFGDNTSLVTSLYFTPRSWSADGGTVA